MKKTTVKEIKKWLKTLEEKHGKIKQHLPISDLFPERVFPPVYGLDMYHLMKGSRITFNVHTKQAK